MTGKKFFIVFSSIVIFLLGTGVYMFTMADDHSSTEKSLTEKKVASQKKKVKENGIPCVKKNGEPCEIDVKKTGIPEDVPCPEDCSEKPYEVIRPETQN